MSSEGGRDGGLRALRALIAADYRGHYEQQGLPDGLRGKLLMGGRMLTNPSMHAIILIRLALCGPRRMHWLWRNMLIAKHGIDLGAAVSIGPGLVLPHPMGICIGRGSSLGRDIAIHHNVTIGASGRHRKTPSRSPRIADGVVIYPTSVVVGAIDVGEAAVIGALMFVDRDVQPGEIVGPDGRRRRRYVSVEPSGQQNRR